MTDIMAKELFEKGRALLKENNTLAALSCFEKAYDKAKLPAIQSYLGLCLAVERGQVKDGIALCREAIERDAENSVHYLNLGRIYLRERKRAEAIALFRKGLAFGDNEEIRQMLDSLGTRKRPLFPFLSRNHFLNKYSGKLLRLLRLR
jgi:tetratricopeptide (TPR) repeat protein